MASDETYLGDDHSVALLLDPEAPGRTALQCKVQVLYTGLQVVNIVVHRFGDH